MGRAIVRVITLVASGAALMEMAFQTTEKGRTLMTFGEWMIVAVTILVPLAGFHIATWKSNRKLRLSIEELLTGQFAYEHEILVRDMAQRENKPVDEIFVTRGKGLKPGLGSWSR